MAFCVFCEIINGTSPCHKVWEDENHLAFLSIFPNTEGVTVVVPKKHYSSYAFDLSDEALSELVLKTKKVAKIIDGKLNDVGRTAMVFEGFGVNHVHSKLFPMHGTEDMKNWKPVESGGSKYFEKYEGYISSHDYKRGDDAKLAELAKKLRE